MNSESEPRGMIMTEETAAAKADKALSKPLMVFIGAVLVAFMGYIGVGDANQSERIKGLEVHSEHMKEGLEAVNKKLDILIDRRP